jgi:hypothetical protein
VRISFEKDGGVFKSRSAGSEIRPAIHSTQSQRLRGARIPLLLISLFSIHLTNRSKQFGENFCPQSGLLSTL